MTSPALNFPFKVQPNVPLAPYTYSKIGGPAQWLTIAHNKEQLIQAVTFARQQKLPLTVLGGGSNILISDDGLKGLIVINRAQAITEDPKAAHHLYVDSGTIVNQLVNYTTSKGLKGLEVFLGIPGTVGGAIYNNSHYQDQLIGNHLASVTVIDQTGKQKVLQQQELDLAYDYSVFHETKDTIIEALFILEPKSDPDKLAAVAVQALSRRRATQPLEYPSSGCMFKNPTAKQVTRHHLPQAHSAYLIDTAGCKGMRIGDAAVSKKHANFIINLGKATAKDFKLLSDQVIQKVRQKYGVTLAREVFLLGNHQSATRGQ